MLSTSTRLGLGLASRPTNVLKSSIVSKQLARTFFNTIPQPPGNIIGTVNDAYVPPKPNLFEGSRHWTFERIVTIGMTPLIVIPFVTGSSTALIDSAMSTLLLYHCFAGFQSCIIDYIPRRVYGSMHTAAMGLLTFGTFIAGYGIYKIENEEDEGIWGILKKLWRA